MPTWRLWAVLGVLAALALLALRGSPQFLSVTAPVEAAVLVVEGWLPDHALVEARNEFESHDYELIVTTGGPLDEGAMFSSYRTYAELAAAALLELGMDPTQVKVAPAPSSRRNRTYAAAIGLKRWLDENRPGTREVNVVSRGAHARRSRLMYQRALGEDCRVGIIAAADRDYPADKWWRYSAGLKRVVTEALAYAHAKLLFDPGLELPPSDESP
jgi:uncharacterized SAM-binding protein YcdF (DUF218 family)